MDSATLGWAGRIVLAMALGGMIGVEREADGHPAGLRTHIAVALGAALFGIISVDGFDNLVDRRAETNVNIDVTRVASQVVVGIGFLGAGTIVKHHGAVRGLTTAASLWVVAAVGLAVGIGAYEPAVLTTLGVLLSLIVLRWPRRWIASRARTPRLVTFHVGPDADLGALVRAIHDLANVEVASVLTRRLDEGHAVEAELKPEPGGDLDAAVRDLSRHADVTGLEIV